MLLIDTGFHTLVYVGERLGFMAFEPMNPPYIVDRGGVLAAEAHARGYQMEVLRVGKRRHDTYRLTMLGRQLVFSGVPRLDRVEKVTSGWIDDKWLLKERLMQYQVPVSRGRVVYSLRGATKVFAELQKPVIVKPRFGSRGRHTTTHINTEADLVAAYRRARQLGWPVMVEEHLVGSVYRATCVGGHVVGILAGDPPRVTGDGVRTIRELIEYKNATRHETQGPVKYTEKLDSFLASLQLTLDSILPAGKEIDLSEKIGLSYGGMSREMIDVTHPALLAEFDRAAAAVADPIIGFDFISTDVTADPATVRWGIIECNSVPFINLHHDPLQGTPADAAGAVFDYLETHLAPAAHPRYQNYLLGGGALLTLLLLMLLPPLLFGPDIRDKDFPRSGEVVRLTNSGFVLGGKRDGRELVVTTTASTTIRGTVAAGQFVQVTGDLVAPGLMTADRVQVLDGPRRQDR